MFPAAVRGPQMCALCADLFEARILRPAVDRLRLSQNSLFFSVFRAFGVPNVCQIQYLGSAGVSNSFSTAMNRLKGDT